MKIRNLFVKHILMWAFLLISFPMLAQQTTVSGTVTGVESGEPLPGVSIVEKGTQNGTTTNMEGEYSITLPEDAVLTFSFVGYVTQEIPVDGRTTINVEMKQKMENYKSQTYLK